MVIITNSRLHLIFICGSLLLFKGTFHPAVPRRGSIHLQSAESVLKGADSLLFYFLLPPSSRVLVILVVLLSIVSLEHEFVFISTLV